MSKHITLSVTPDREKILDKLIQMDKTGIGLSGMIGIAAQEYVQKDDIVHLLPTIKSSPSDWISYARTCDTPHYKDLQLHSMVINSVLKEEDQRRI